MTSDEPGPGQQYALQARKHIATLRRARPDIVIEIRWYPAHKGVAGNEKSGRVVQGGSGAVRQPQAHSAISRQPQAGNLREEVVGGTPMGRGLNFQEEVPLA